MFCPKCGTKNPEDGKFCRSCGVDIAGVSLVMSGGSSLSEYEEYSGSLSCNTTDPKEAVRRKDPSEVYGDAIKEIISGIGFFIVAAVLFTTGVAGGRAWWWAMLFPAFTFLARGISDMLKSRKMEQALLRRNGGNMVNELSASQTNGDLPPARTNFVAPESRFATGDLVPPSVTDNTTRQLEVNREAETMTLPKR